MEYVGPYVCLHLYQTKHLKYRGSCIEPNQMYYLYQIKGCKMFSIGRLVISYLQSTKHQEVVYVAVAGCRLRLANIDSCTTLVYILPFLMLHTFHGTCLRLTCMCWVLARHLFLNLFCNNNEVRFSLQIKYRITIRTHYLSDVD